MERSTKFCMAVFAIAGAVAMPAHAAPDTVPDMKGTWVATSTGNGVIFGESEHHPQSKKDAVYFTQDVPKLTLVIDQQEGRRFVGKLSSPTSSELVIGVLSTDRKSGVMVAHEGQHTFTLVGKNRMNKCYTQTGAHLVAACITWERTK